METGGGVEACGSAGDRWLTAWNLARCGRGGGVEPGSAARGEATRGGWVRGGQTLGGAEAGPIWGSGAARVVTPQVPTYLEITSKVIKLN